MVRIDIKKKILAYNKETRTFVGEIRDLKNYGMTPKDFNNGTKVPPAGLETLELFSSETNGSKQFKYSGYDLVPNRKDEVGAWKYECKTENIKLLVFNS